MHEMTGVLEETNLLEANTKIFIFAISKNYQITQ